MVLDSPHLGKPNVDTGVFPLQPQTHFDKVTRSQELRGRKLGTGLGHFQYTAFGFNLAVHTDQDAVDRRRGSGPTSLLFSYSHRLRLA